MDQRTQGRGECLGGSVLLEGWEGRGVSLKGWKAKINEFVRGLK